MTAYAINLAQSSTPPELGGALALDGLLLLVLVAFSGAFSGSETVLFSLTPYQLQSCRTSGNPFRRLAATLMARPKQTLMIILVGNTFVNVLLFATSFVLAKRLDPLLGWWVVPIGALISIGVVLFGGEIVPKVLAVALADRLAPLSAGIVHFSGYVLGPVGRVIDWVLVEPSTRLLLGRTGRDAHRAHDLTAEELKTLLEMNRREGVIDREEDAYLREVIDLREVRVADIMVPRVEVAAFDVDGDPEELRALIRRTRRTKVPVYDGSIDNIIGLIYAKVLFFEPRPVLRKLVTPVHFVPEVINCEQLLEHFRATRTQLAIVVDEFGGMEGLVALEDVLEEIVGEIAKPEQEPETPEIVRISDTQYEISAAMSVRYWAETFGIPHLTERVTTVAGLMAARLGRPLQAGDTIRVANMEMRVAAMTGRRPQRLELRLLAPAAGASGGAGA